MFSFDNDVNLPSKNCGLVTTGLLNVGDILSTWFSVGYIGRKEEKAENSRTAK